MLGRSGLNGVVSDDPVLRCLRERFGFPAFRDGQEQVVRALLAERSALAVFPTGGGKSLCYQLPALLLDGITLVISPLIALMKDQVDALAARGIAAARLDSTLDHEQSQVVFDGIADGSLKILFIAPERIANEGFRERLKKMPVSLVAIDEAHCISEWGHNFRPDYLKLARLCKKLRVPRVLALTATATPKVAADIRKAFRIARADHTQLSFHRHNLDLRVSPSKASERKEKLAEILDENPGPAVIYVTRQETAEEVATYLQSRGYAARAYHAGLPAEVRADAQNSFMAGDMRIVVATIAFGMGIDKADIRTVVHYNLPKSMENYAQETGRAGRDGHPAVCRLLACGDDLVTLENFIYGDTPQPRALRGLIDRVLRLGDSFDISVYDLANSCDIRPLVVSTVLTYLEVEGILEGTGMFYHTYKARLLRAPAAILAGTAGRERKLLERLLEAGEPGRSWTLFEPTALSEKIGAPRAKIVASLHGLEAAGDIILQQTGVRQAFRIRKQPGELNELAARLADKFRQREVADLARLRDVLGLASRKGCLTAYLTAYFGEKLAGPCGHCDRCRGIAPVKVPRTPRAQPDDAAWQRIRGLVAEHHAALATPRQLARFLCGMSSPATTRERLSRHDAFGLLASHPFADVLAIAEAQVPGER